MALLSDLVRIIAKIEGLEEVSVGIFARHAREAGYITQGGRGRSAAKMSIRDAANLLIAVNGCSLAKDVPDLVGRFRDLPASLENTIKPFGLSGEGAKFGDDFELLLDKIMAEKFAADRGSLAPPIYIRFVRPGLLVDIEFLDGTKIRYHHKEDGDAFDGPDRWDETVISSNTLRAVVRAF